MGLVPSDCKHERRELIRVVGKEEGALAYSEFADWKCLDCLTNSKPTTLRIEQVKGNLTDHVYSEKIYSEFARHDKCDHHTFHVDKNTLHKESFHEPSFEDILLKNSGNYSWNVAAAECVRCSRKFKVRCAFKKDSQWENYQHVVTSVPDEHWEIMYKEKTESKQVKEPVYV